MGICHQNSVNKKGKIVKKDRAVHDLPCSRKNRKAINQCTMMWGHLAASCMAIVSFGLTNNLIINPHCDLDDLNDPLEDLILEKDRTRDNPPLSTALLLNIMFPPQPLAKVDGYIDDDHTTAVYRPENFKRAKVAFPLVLGLLFRKSGKDKPVPKQEILQKKKIMAEGMPSKTKMFLGWLIGSRLHKVNLSIKKGLNGRTPS
eukprot:316975-Ditylum_brightwellii.AAC.1